jgi:hypothetical protein
VGGEGEGEGEEGDDFISSSIFLFFIKALPSSIPIFVPAAVANAVVPTIATLGAGAIPPVYLKASEATFPTAAPIPKLGAISEITPRLSG